MTKPLENLAIRVAYHLLKYSLHENRPRLDGKGDRRRLSKIFDLLETHRRAELSRQLATDSDFTVQHGFFKGLKVPPKTSWGDDIMPKILGTYEEELIPVFDGLKDVPFSRLINIGCADGFFAVGLANQLKFKRVLAIDTNVAALEVCKENRAANDVSTPFEYLPTIDGAGLSEVLQEHPNSLVLCDCEGYEKELFGDLQAETASRAHFIIECHDFVDRSITEQIEQKLSATHNLSKIIEGARNPNAFGELKALSNSDRWQAMNELRPERMHWIYAVPKK